MPTTRQRGCARFPRSSSCGGCGSRNTTARSTAPGRRWPGGRTKTSRPADNGSVRRMTPTLDTRPSAAPASEGYKVHLSETCDDTTATSLPHLITNVATTDATLTDVEMLEHIHTGLDHRNLLPDEHIVDAGYTSAELMVSTRRDFRSR